jgi:hypothetical protein
MSDILVTTPGDVTIDVTPGGDVTVEVTYNPVAGSGGDTNIGITPTASTVVVTSSSGTDGTILAASGTDAGVFTAANYTKLAAISGTNTGDQFIFKNVAVSGQSTVIAETTNDTLTLVAGTNVTITTDAGTDSVTINASGGGGTGDVVGPASATDGAVALYDGTTGKLLKNGVVLGTAATTASTAYTSSSVVPNTAPAAGQVLVGNAGGTAYAPVSASGDATLASTGALTLATVNSNVGSYGSATAAPPAQEQVPQPIGVETGHGLLLQAQVTLLGQRVPPMVRSLFSTRRQVNCSRMAQFPGEPQRSTSAQVQEPSAQETTPV